MSTFVIRSEVDVMIARNLLRKRIVGTNWTPVIRAQASAILMTFSELVLRSHNPGQLNIAVINNQGVHGIQLNCEVMQENEQAVMAKLREQLAAITSDIEFNSHQPHLRITARIWANKSL